ncbi:MAG: hypothetical protein ACLQOO_06175 [Terriglobia bacterium]
MGGIEVVVVGREHHVGFFAVENLAQDSDLLFPLVGFAKVILEGT